MSCAADYSNPAARAAGGLSSPMPPAATLRGWREYSPDERAEVVARLIQDFTGSQIAAMFGVTRNAVGHFMSERGIRAPQRPQMHVEPAIQQRKRDAERIKDLYRQGYSREAAAVAMGISAARVFRVMKGEGFAREDVTKAPAHITLWEGRIVTTTERLRFRAAAREAQKRAAKAKKRAEAEAQRRARNPKLSAAQQANVDAHKSRMWDPTRLAHLPPVQQDEAERLVAEFIAKRGVTVCPPAASPETPHNSLVRWK